jgi:hypothetical protein
MSIAARSGRVVAVLAFGLLSSCGGDGPTKPAPGEPGIHFVAGAASSDTVGALFAQALVVEVRRSDGSPAAGEVVRLESAFTGPDVWPGPVYDLEVASPASNLFVPIFADTTDAKGRLTVLVKLGTVAGKARLAVSVPALGMQDTARYTVLPGAAVGIRIFPRDTALAMGGTAELRASVIDRFLNTRSDEIRVTPRGQAVVLSGTEVTAQSFGRARLDVRSGTMEDSVFVSVVPQGTLAGFTDIESTGQAVALYTMETDGHLLQKVRETVVGPGYAGDMPATWTARGTQLVYHDNNWDHSKQLYLLDLTTGDNRRFLPVQDQMQMEEWPYASSGGEWVYFTGGTYSRAALYRAHQDGTGLQKLTPDDMPNESQGTPSPDGKRLAYVLADGGFGSLAIMDLETGKRRSLGISGASPRWSPAGNEIAFIAWGGSSGSDSGVLAAVGPDGSNIRTITRSAATYYPLFDYSPDGKYIAAVSRQGVLTIIDVQSGIEVPVVLPALERPIIAPAWKP